MKTVVFKIVVDDFAYERPCLSSMYIIDQARYCSCSPYCNETLREVCPSYNPDGGLRKEWTEENRAAFYNALDEIRRGLQWKQ